MPEIITNIRFLFFKVIELGIQLTNCRQIGLESSHINSNCGDAGDRKEFLWVYASTIGELHAVEPILKNLLNAHPNWGLVIVSDHTFYRDSYLKLFEQALVVNHGESGKIEKLIEKLAPVLLIIAEIPCLLHDAPCRFSYRVLHEMKKRSVPVCVLNGWIYKEGPSCRMDRIEIGLFKKDYLDAIDMFLMQTEEGKSYLITNGVDREKIHVTGNMKFDAIKNAKNLIQAQEDLRTVLDALARESRPCVIAGCITNVSEQEYVLDAFKIAVRSVPNILLVIAPRHPENSERMEILGELLDDRGLTYFLRSEFSDSKLRDSAVMVLDSIGELRYLYAEGDICYVGLNHNILEPLSFGKMVFVTRGWEQKFPSYPVYKESLNNKLIAETATSFELATKLINYLNVNMDKVNRDIDCKLTRLSGATRRNSRLITDLLSNQSC